MMKSEKEFVYDTAAQIYASMFANPDVKEDMKYAIERAIALWDELKKINLLDNDHKNNQEEQSQSTISKSNETE